MVGELRPQLWQDPSGARRKLPFPTLTIAALSQTSTITGTGEFENLIGKQIMGWLLLYDPPHPYSSSVTKRKAGREAVPRFKHREDLVGPYGKR